MPINTIALAEKMTTELDKAVVQKSVTGFLADNALRAKFVGAGTVLIPNVDFQGLGNYSRDNGFVQGSITVANTSYDLTMDRGRTFQLDEQDADESGIPGLSGQVMGEFVRTKVVPEMDAYVLSKLGNYAETNSQTVTGTPASQAYKMFSDACNKIYGELGYDQELVCFVNSSLWAAMQSTTEITRHLDVGSFKQGGIDLKVQTLNGITIRPVPDSRMHTVFTFNDGSTTGQEAGGFTVPGTGSKNIGLLIIAKGVASLVKKTEKVRIFSPDTNQKADAWKFDYRLYYDAFLKNSMKKGVVAYNY